MTTRTPSRPDAHGNPVSGERIAIDLYDTAIDRYLRFHPDVVTHTTALVTDHPDFAMGQALAAYLSLTSTDTPDLAGAQDAAAAMDAVAVNEREAAHRVAIGSWLAGDWREAARGLDDVLLRWPADLLALLVGHQLDFFLGDAANLRDRVGRSVGRIDPTHPHHGFVRGMYSFGLEESGRYDLAHEHGMTAVEANRDDVWAIHAVVHVHEMRGDVDEGIRFLSRREADWARGNLFTVHNWWHRALFLLEAGMVDEALAIYDAHIHHAESAGVPLEMVDAAALLWRLFLEGVDVGGRFASLANAWSTRVTDEPWYVFNDFHAVMTLCGAGRLAEARAVIERLSRSVETSDPSRRTNVAMTVEVGLPACLAVLAYAEGRDDDVLDALMPARAAFNRFGGSHAQRDVLQRTVLAAALRGGSFDVAAALISERLGVRPSSVYALAQSAALAAARGQGAHADRAAAAAAEHRTRFAAVARLEQ
jgi:hypothetical protein